VDIVATIAQTLETSAVGEWMRTSLKAMPVIEAIHVLTAAVVFGTILIVDLRLLGVPSTRRAVTRIHEELVRFTWAAFGVSVVTGLLMFAPNATTYFRNTAFGLKMLSLLAAGVNMAIFEGRTFRSVTAWDRDVPTPPAARLAGALSILIWAAVIFFARWIGFTKGYNFAIPDDVDLNFEFPPP
jgi:hypothetical protein